MGEGVELTTEGAVDARVGGGDVGADPSLGSEAVELAVEQAVRTPARSREVARPRRTAADRTGGVGAL